MDTQAQIDKILKRLDDLQERRISQEMILPDAVKMRHQGEGVRFIQTGLAANRPTTPSEPDKSALIYFAYDTSVLYVWNVSTNSYKSTTLS